VPLLAEGLLCPACRRAAPAFATSAIPFAYEAPIDRLVKALKFRGDLTAARELAAWFVAELREDRRPECLLPVPLHKRRLIERGYNQAVEIGAHLSRELRIPLDVQLCRRIRHTVPQTDLKTSERRRNVRGAFAVVRTPRYRHVAIVDDVVTTGSTVGELARALRRAGVSLVEVWAIARAGAEIP
jgi:ComF family protein